MATAQSWIDRTRSLLLSGRQGQRNSLAAPYTAGSGTLSLADEMNGVVAGARLSVGTNTFYVRSVDSANSVVAVFAAQEGTTDANASTGAVVLVAPLFTDADILDALNGDLADLSGPGNGLWQMKTVDLTYANATIGYDLAAVTDLIDLYELRAQASGTAMDWPRIDKVDWRLDRNSDVALFPSGLSLQIFGYAYQGLKVRALYRAGFTALTDATTDLSVTGLPLTAYDLPPWGAALRLMAPREVKRNFTEAQGDTRRATEVPAGAVQGSYRGIAAIRAQRIASEAERLVARYPDRRW